MTVEGVCFICCKISNTNCSQCQDVFYCSKECQLADWKRHKVDCGTIRKFVLKDLSKTYGFCQRGLVMRTPAKIGEVLYEEKPYLFVSGMISDTDSENTERVLHLDKCEHRVVGGHGDKNADLCLELFVLLLIHDQRRAKAILKQCEKTPAQRKSGSPPPDEIFQELTKLLMLKGKRIDFVFWDVKKIGLVYDHVMSYYFWSETLDGNLLGSAYDPLIGSINHACNPNVFTRILPDRVLVIAAKELEVGDELTITYFFTAFGIFDNDVLARSVRVNCGFDCACAAHDSIVPHLSPGKHINELEKIFSGCEKKDNLERSNVLWSRCKGHLALTPESEEFDAYSGFKLGYHMLILSKQIDDGLNPEIGLWAASIMKCSSERNRVNTLAPKIMANWEYFKHRLLIVSEDLVKRSQKVPNPRETSELQLNRFSEVMRCYVALEKLLLNAYGNKKDLVEQILVASTFFLDDTPRLIFEEIILPAHKKIIDNHAYF